MERDYLKLAKDAYSSSTTYIDANYRKKWDDALRMFQSRHPQDSKYNTETYKHRSKIFRPKTRALVRKHEAAVAAAFFSNIDVINTEAVNQDDKNQSASAALMKEIIQFRLSKSIPWFQVVCGAMQDAMNIGVVCSYQYWKYKAKDLPPTLEPVIDEMGNPVFDEMGIPQIQSKPQKDVLEDKPCIELIPIENIRFDPAADWTNPAVSSPYLIRMIPMYVCDVKSQMQSGDDETNKKWKKLSDGQIRSAMKSENDQTRQTREMLRQDPTDTGNAPITDYEICWVHENFFRIDGEEKVFYTLGTEFMLTEVSPLKDVYFHGERPIIIGKTIIETHKAMPESPVMIAEQLQREVNEVANQRIDNVKLVLNKRYVVKRGAQVDLKSIVRNVPGSITLANDPVGDVREFEFNDVTASSYQEQDRLNVDYDELTGNFSQGSVMTNRKVGETVGGMGMISQAANQITEYTIRVLTETWVEPVLRQLVKLEQKYETDEVILAIAAGKAKLLQKYGISHVTDKLLNNELTLTVNVGMGATDPSARLNKFMGALGAYANVAQMQIPNMNMEEIGKEVFALAGFRDGARFTAQQGTPEQQIKMMQQQAMQMQEQMQQMGQELQAAQGQLQQAKSGLEIKGMEIQSKHELAGEEQRIAESKLQIEYNFKVRQSELDAKFQREKSEIDAQLIIEKAQQEQVLKFEIAKLEVQSKEEIAELNAWVELQKIGKENAALSADVNKDLNDGEPQESAKPTRKTISMVNKVTGATYEGIIEDGVLTMKAPSGTEYSAKIAAEDIKNEPT